MHLGQQSLGETVIGRAVAIGEIEHGIKAVDEIGDAILAEGFQHRHARFVIKLFGLQGHAQPAAGGEPARLMGGDKDIDGLAERAIKGFRQIRCQIQHDGMLGVEGDVKARQGGDRLKSHVETITGV
jgi:hypothetical protein